jgi:hypothetical protein
MSELVDDEEILDDFAIFKMGIFRKIVQSGNQVSFSFVPNDLLSKSQIVISLEEVLRELANEFSIQPTVQSNCSLPNVIEENWTFTNADKKIIDDIWYSHPHKFGMVKCTRTLQRI